MLLVCIPFDIPSHLNFIVPYVFQSWEIYWDAPKGAFTDLTLSSEATAAKDQILQNVLVAAKKANIQHMVVVDNGSLLPLLKSSGVPYTCFLVGAPTGRALTDSPNYTFKGGVCGDLVISSVNDDVESIGGDSGSGAPSVCREDLAALCVQSLQSLSWDKSRCLTVSCNGPVKLPSAARGPEKRVDQQWCVNSFVLEDKLAGIA